ncbi:MAG: response regulator [Candidatus Abyssobacteria bacterium SURF_5]|uniref:Response regulator n=1 Tax=Abyssobacteria bacterium (strain SURF_5) TaxID=2093360 RepID=A0A3A4P8X4_ABYX5|nr:MAG: response regulator [Candidatus Abyssubacteria bacterium SURF_5]
MAGKKIAIIDDEPDVVIYLTSALQDNGFEVCSAPNATEGFALIRSQRPDLVCLDILMPEETGFSLYRKIRDDSSLKDMRVVIISGLNIKQEMPRILSGRNGDAAAVEPDFFIEKPIDLPLFIHTVRRLTGAGEAA